MKVHLLVIILCVCSIQAFYSQEDDGVVSLAIPTRNSLTFNRFTFNPTFSFVREQTKYISIYNKREWVQFENAPLTYLASYSGRFAENIGAGISLFQQNYGVLTTFGGILNFAYNARLGRDSNLTFGLNIGAYKSGVNTSNVVTNFEDPSLQNVPENFLLTINPGINYGTEFLDFGLTVNNLVLYNFKSSELIQDNPQQSIQAHMMYTGYMDSRGFFDESKFTGLVKAEFQKDKTIISGLAMLTVPKGIWGQVGYNTLYGASGGIGINITTQIAIEYNYEIALGNLQPFGSSHEITLAYRFKNNNYYDYSREDEVSSILSTDNRRRRSSKTSKPRTASTKSPVETKAVSEAEAQAKLLAAKKAKEEADAQAKLLEEQKAKADAVAQAKLLEEEKLKAAADVQAKIEADKKAKEIADTRARILAEQKAKEEADAQAKLLIERKAKAEAEAQAKLLAEQKAKEEAAALAILLAEQKAEAEAKAQAELLAEQKAKQEEDAQAKLLIEQKAKAEAEAQAKLLAEQKAKEEAAALAVLLAEQKVKEEAEAQAKFIAEQKAKDDLIENPQDELGKSMQALAKQTADSKKTQTELLKQFDDIVAIKDNDLSDLKEENDLSDQGITVQPKPFKSVTAENNTLNAIKSDLDNVIKTRNEKIDDLKALYEQRTKIKNTELDEVNLFYKNEIKRLSQEQLKAIETRAQLDARLEMIKVATEFEKRRRIKRADYDNEEDRYSQDRATLKNIKQTTSISDTPLNVEDFDFGEVQSNNIKILKNIKNVESGYYVVIAVHSNTEKRNDFVTKVVASGRTNVDFFHDVNTSKYYIYYDKFDSIENANKALNAKGDRPYNQKMSIVKIEN